MTLPVSSSPVWLSRFPALAGLDPSITLELGARARTVALPAGSRIFGPGQAPDSYLLLTAGAVRVQQVAENGREIVLYRVSAGESCALTTACLMAYEDYLAEAIAETDIEAVTIARATFDDLIARSPEFRRFVFTAFSTRVTDLCRIIDEVAFQRVDCRLARALIELSHGGPRIEATQQQLAAELGTAREVISRMLSEFQRRGLISTTRGGVQILDRPKLAAIAADH